MRVLTQALFSLLSTIFYGNIQSFNGNKITLQRTSKFTKSVIAAGGLRVIEWPPFSPDLSPIETIWDDMKDYIQAKYP